MINSTKLFNCILFIFLLFVANNKTFSNVSETKDSASFFKIENLRIGTTYQMYSFFHRYNRHQLLNEINEPLPDFEYDFSLNPNSPYRSFALDSQNNYILADEYSGNTPRTRADWRRIGLDFSFDFKRSKRFTFYNTVGIVYGQANVIDRRIYNNHIDTFGINYDPKSSFVQKLDMFTTVKTMGLSFALGYDFKLSRRWSIGNNLLLNYGLPVQVKSYFMEHEGLEVFSDRVCFLSCSRANDIVPVQKQRQDDGANLYPIERNLKGNVFDMQLLLKTKYRLNDKFLFYFQTGAYLGGKHHGRDLYQEITLRPHILFFGLEYSILNKA